MVTLRRAGGASYEPVTTEADDRDEAAATARTRMAEQWGVEPDSLETVSVEPAEPG
jgi:hypothetical protein